MQKAEVVEGIVGLVCRHRLDGGEMECSHRWSVILHRNCPSKCFMGLQTTHPLCGGEWEKRGSEEKKLDNMTSRRETVLPNGRGALREYCHGHSKNGVCESC